MADQSEVSERWYFGKEQLRNSPSVRDGIEYTKELGYRQQCANFIQDMGQRLIVNQLTINTAIVYMHRFYMLHSFKQFHRNVMAPCFIFLAAKIEENPRKLEHVLKVAHRCLHKEEASIDIKSEEYMEMSQELVNNESILLQTLGFELSVEHPHSYVVKCAQLVRASKELAQTAYFLATNSLHLTTFSVQYKPTIVSCICIFVACKWASWEIPTSKDKKSWWEYVDNAVTTDLLEELSSYFIKILDNCPARLKRKITSGPVVYKGGNLQSKKTSADIGSSSSKLGNGSSNKQPNSASESQTGLESTGKSSPKPLKHGESSSSTSMSTANASNSSASSSTSQGTSSHHRKSHHHHHHHSHHQSSSSKNHSSSSGKSGEKEATSSSASSAPKRSASGEVKPGHSSSSKQVKVHSHGQSRHHHSGTNSKASLDGSPAKRLKSDSEKPINASNEHVHRDKRSSDGSSATHSSKSNEHQSHRPSSSQSSNRIAQADALRKDLNKLLEKKPSNSNKNSHQSKHRPPAPTAPSINMSSSTASNTTKQQSRTINTLPPPPPPPPPAPSATAIHMLPLVPPPPIPTLGNISLPSIGQSSGSSASNPYYDSSRSSFTPPIPSDLPSHPPPPPPISPPPPPPPPE